MDEQTTMALAQSRPRNRSWRTWVIWALVVGNILAALLLFILLVSGEGDDSGQGPYLNETGLHLGGKE
jgi:hypothetical protein